MMQQGQRLALKTRSLYGYILSGMVWRLVAKTKYDQSNKDSSRPRLLLMHTSAAGSARCSSFARRGQMPLGCSADHIIRLIHDLDGNAKRCKP